MNIKVSNEQEEFGIRLWGALASAGYAEITYSQLTEQFNARSSGKSITKFAARKWMHGEAIPTQERLLVIAVWLQVNPEWLRFGGVNKVDIDTLHSHVENEMLLAMLAALDGPAKQLVRELLGLLLDVSHAKRIRPTQPSKATVPATSDTVSRRDRPAGPLSDLFRGMFD